MKIYDFLEIVSSPNGDSAQSSEILFVFCTGSSILHFLCNCNTLLISESINVCFLIYYPTFPQVKLISCFVTEVACLEFDSNTLITVGYAKFYLKRFLFQIVVVKYVLE